MSLDPVMDINPQTGKHQIRLVNGDPVPTDDPGYQVLSLLTEDPWLAEDIPREGSIEQEFREQTSVSPSALKVACERRCRPLQETSPQTLVDFVVTSVTQPEDGVLKFEALYRRPGQPDQETTVVELGT